MSQVIVFIRGNGVTKMDVAKTVRDLGYELAVAEKGYKNPNKIADYVIDTDTNNLDTLISDIAEFAMEHEVAAILSLTEFGIEQAAAVTQVLGYPGPNFKSIKKCRNKYLTRIEMKKHGLPTPGFFKAKSLSEIKAKINSVKLPVVIKPLNFAGSCAIVKVDRLDELDHKFDSLLSQRKVAPVKDYMLDTTEDYWLLEEYLDGFEISVESLTYQGQTFVIAIHDKMCAVEAPYFLEEFFVTPSPRISPELSATIENMTKKALAAIDFDFGLSHVEYRVTKEGPVLLEINGRQGGGLIPESVCYSTGISMLQNLVKMSLKMPVEIVTKEHKPVVFQTLIAPEGRINKVNGFEAVKNIQELKIVEQWIKEGDIVKARQANYGGFLLATGNSLDQIIDIVKKAAAKIEFIVE